jgi:hypothetical protein
MERVPAAGQVGSWPMQLRRGGCFELLPVPFPVGSLNAKEQGCLYYVEQFTEGDGRREERSWR